MPGRKNRALQVPYVVSYIALGNFPKALHVTMGSTYSARFFHPVMEHKIVKNPNWPGARQLAIYEYCRRSEHVKSNQGPLICDSHADLSATLSPRILANYYPCVAQRSLIYIG